MHLNSLMQQLGSMGSTAWNALNSDYALRGRIAGECAELIQRANSPDGAQAYQFMHNFLAVIYQRDFSRQEVSESECETQPVLRDIAAIFEKSMLDDELASVRDLVSDYPTNGREFVQWLKLLISGHPASRHPYYQSYLPEHGTREDMRFLLAQETSLDPRFDDILALIQIGTQGREKMEIAANYWDEMGIGEHGSEHSALFARTLSAINIDSSYIKENLQIEAKLCGNLSAALALSRRHYYKAIGYFGVTEYLAPRRFRSLTQAWRRLELPLEGIRYHDIHIEVDAGHAVGWLKNVIEPTVDRDPNIGREIASGALVRLNTSARYLDALLARTNSLETL